MKRKSESSLALAFASYGLGRFVPQLVGFALLPIYSRYLTPSELGIAELAMVVQMLFVNIGRAGLAGAITRFYYDYGEGERFRSLVSTVTFATLGFTGLLIALAAGLGPLFWSHGFSDIPFFPCIFSALLGALPQQANDIEFRLLQARQQAARAGRITAQFGVVATLLNVALVVGLRLGPLGLIWAGTLAATVRAVLAAIVHRHDLTGRWSIHELRAAGIYGLPLVPHHLASWAQQFIGRLVLSGVASAEALGQLGIAARIVSPFTLVTAAFASAVLPVYFEWRSSLPVEVAQQRAQDLGRVVCLGGAFLMMGATCAGRWFIGYLLDPSYAAAAVLLGPLAWARWGTLLYTLVSSELFYIKRTANISLIFIIASVVNMGVSIPLGHAYGALGAAIGELAGSVTSVVVVAALSPKSQPLPLPKAALLISTVLGILGAAIAWLPFSNLWVDGIAALLGIVLCGGLVWALAGEDFKSMAGWRRKAKGGAAT